MLDDNLFIGFMNNLKINTQRNFKEKNILKISKLEKCKIVGVFIY